MVKAESAYKYNLMTFSGWYGIEVEPTGLRGSGRWVVQVSVQTDSAIISTETD